MAKLYWRVTINGKRTWRPAKVTEHYSDKTGARYWIEYPLEDKKDEETKSES